MDYSARMHHVYSGGYNGPSFLPSYSPIEGPDFLHQTMHAIDEIANAHRLTRANQDVQLEVDPSGDGPPTTSNPFYILATPYLLLNVFVVLGLGTTKLVLTIQGYSLVPTLLDWFIGSLFAFG